MDDQTSAPTIDATAIDGKALAVERFKERIKKLEEEQGIRFLAVYGRQHVVETDETFLINSGEARNPARDLRRMLSPISGRQLVRFRKRLRRYQKSKAIEGLVKSGPDESS